MSYKAEIDFILHLHAFKNIQIERQGFVAVRVEIFDNSAPNGNVALPFNIIEYSKPKEFHLPPIIDDQAFQTSTLRIQYQDQKYEINDIIQFKLLIQSLPHLKVDEVYLKMTLLFSTLYGFQKEFDLSADKKEELILKLQSIETGTFHYFEGEFTGNYASSVSFTLFSMINNFKFYPYRMREEVINQQEKQRKKEKDRQKVNDFYDMLAWSTKYVKKCHNALAFFYNTYLKTLRYNSYVLKTRVNEFLKDKKQIVLKLPKFYLADQAVDGKKFFDFFTNFDGENVSIEDFKTEERELHEQNFFFMQEVISWLSGNLIDLKKMKAQYKRFMDSQFQAKLIQDITYGRPVISSSNASRNLQLASKIRKQQKSEQPYPITKYSSEQKDEQYLFYEISYPESFRDLEIQSPKKTNLNIPYDERNMLIVMCHGFQGSSFDMKIIQRGLKEIFPLAEFLVSTTNELDTESDIQSLGFRLGKEIGRYIDREALNEEQLILNFVGHSMGGIIARASLKYLKKYHKQLGFYCSLSSPHLGYLHGTSTMIKTGLWFMRKINETKSLDQLTMNDTEKVQESFLYQLSQSGSLKKFHKIILLSSAQDSYVPWHSARISHYKSSSKTGKLQDNMVQNILGESVVHRIDVNFAVKKNDLDGFIGRKAHINLIIQDTVFKLLNTVLPKLFDLRQM